MRSVTSMSEAAKIAAPSPELCLIAGLIIAQTRGKPKKVGEMVGAMRSFVDAQREMAGVVRIRGAEYDADVMESMAQAAAWLERMEPFLAMMARR